MLPNYKKYAYWLVIFYFLGIFKKTEFCWSTIFIKY